MKTSPVLILTIIFVLTTAAFSQKNSPADVKLQTARRAGIKSVPAKTFQSDGCTLWFNGEYRKCCDSHDLAYFNSRGWRARLRADNRLFECVAKIGFTYSIVAPVMWLGVRLFGSPWFPLHKTKKTK